MFRMDADSMRQARLTRESFWASERLRYRREGFLVASVCCFILAVMIGMTLLLGR
jgi:hypothetical protein